MSLLLCQNAYQRIFGGLWYICNNNDNKKRANILQIMQSATPMVEWNDTKEGKFLFGENASKYRQEKFCLNLGLGYILSLCKVVVASK